MKRTINLCEHTIRGRIVLSQGYDRIFATHLQFRTTTPPPAILSANFESREQGLEFYKLSFGTSNHDPKVYMNFDADTVLLETEFDIPDNQLPLSQCETSILNRVFACTAGVQMIQRLAFKFSWETRVETAHWQAHLTEHLPNVEEFICYCPQKANYTQKHRSQVIKAIYGIGNACSDCRSYKHLLRLYRKRQGLITMFGAPHNHDNRVDVPFLPDVYRTRKLPVVSRGYIMDAHGADTYDVYDR